MYCSELLGLSYDTVVCSGSAGLGTFGNLTAALLQRAIGLRGRSLSGISMHILKKISQAKTYMHAFALCGILYTSADGSFEYCWNLWSLQVNRAHGNCCVDNLKAPTD